MDLQLLLKIAIKQGTMSEMIELNVRPDQIGCTRMDVPLKRIDQKLKQAYAGH